MNKNTDERLFILMAHAEDLQGVADKSLAAVKRATEHLEESALKVITATIEEKMTQTIRGTQNGLQGVNTALLETSAEVRATSCFLKSTGWKLICLLGGAIIVFSMVFWFALLGLHKSRQAELADLRAAIAAERGTLAKLQSETWQLELVTYRDGRRGILLPKGTTIEWSGTVPNDGREGIVIR